MSSFSGFVQAALQLGLESLVEHPKRGLVNIVSADGSSLPDIVPQIVMEERHIDQMEVTDHPIEQGASIADHAFKRPAEVVLHLGWSNSPSDNGSLVNAAIGAASSVSPLVRKVANVVEIGAGIMSAMSGSNVDQVNYIYGKLLELQETRALFDIDTGKRQYKNMVCKTLTVETDSKTEYSLLVTMHCQQVIIVNTSVKSVPKSSLASPFANQKIVDKGLQSVKTAVSGIGK
jgi:hypothetical protein